MPYEQGIFIDIFPLDSVPQHWIGRMLSNIKYFAGHRPVTGNYYLRQNGYFVQIHNPEKQNIVLVYTNKDINLEEDIKTISE